MKGRFGWGVVVGGTCLVLLAAMAGQGVGQAPDGRVSGFRVPLGAGADDLAVSAQFTAPAGGKPGVLYVTARLKPGWFLYSITQPAGPAGGPTQTRIKLRPSEGYRLAGKFRHSPPPKVKTEPAAYGDLPLETHPESVTWHVPIELGEGVDPKTLKIQGSVYAQVCTQTTCLTPRDYPFVAALGRGMDIPDAGQPPDTKGFDVKEAPGVPPDPDVRPGTGKTPASGSGGFNAELLRKHVGQQGGGKSFWAILGLGFVGGLLLNLMPCVLPVIGLKVLSFVEQSGHDRRTALALNVWYSLGLLAVFWVLASLAVVLNLGWGEQFQRPWFNVLLAAVVFAMGLSFLGVWEFPIPGFVGRGSAAALAEKEGAAGAFSKGVVTTVLATPCTGPFMGTALTWALTQPAAAVFAVFTSVGLGMASPFLLIGAFPELVRFLPRPGAWMETFKHLMGFVLLGVVVYLLTFTETSYLVPAVGLLFGLWAGCWWIARTPPTAEPGAKARAWLEAAAWVGMVWILMFPGLFGFQGLHGVMASRLDRSAELWRPFTTPADLHALVVAENTVVVDFTADWCLNCKVLEATVLNTVPIREAIRANRVLALKADNTQEDPGVSTMMELLGVRQVPVLAIFPAGRPNEPIVFLDGYTQRMVLDALKEAGPSESASSPIGGARRKEP